MCIQLIHVTTIGSRCHIVLDDFQCEGFCGKNGSCVHKTEGDGKTPLGRFPIYFGFYRNQRPETALPMVKLQPGHIWVDDPAAASYNRLLFGPTPRKGEHLWHYSFAYQMGLVIEYNRSPVIASKGSAIFLHCGNRPTAGCIAAAPSHIEALLQRLHPQKDPHIVIE